MKEIFNKSFIESVASSDNTEFAAQMQEKILGLLSIAVEDLSSKVPFITTENVIVQPVNELFNGCVTPMSDYVYFLGINSPQMEFNCLHYRASFKKFKEKFIKAWYDSKKRKSKRRKRKEAEEMMTYSEFEPEKYNFDDLRHDLQIAFVENLSNTSIVYNMNDRLVIQGKDDFGSLSEIQIIPVIFSDDKYKYFISKRKGFLEIDMEERLLNFNMKYEIVGDNLLKVLKVFNNIFRTISKQSINQIFVESLLFNVPNELFEGENIYIVFRNIANYLNMTDFSKFVSIENKNEPIYKNKLTANSVGLFYKFIKKIN